MGKILPHLAYLGISAQLKILKISACKIGHEVVLYNYSTSQPASQPPSHPVTYIESDRMGVRYTAVYLRNP
jgi:hypothetical protein